MELQPIVRRAFRRGSRRETYRDRPDASRDRPEAYRDSDRPEASGPDRRWPGRRPGAAWEEHLVVWDCRRRGRLWLEGRPGACLSRRELLGVASHRGGRPVRRAPCREGRPDQGQEWWPPALR